ncbi:arylsulfotransferase, partial [Kipferlia bialata]
YSEDDFSIPPEKYTIWDLVSASKEAEVPTSMERAEKVGEQHWDLIVEFAPDRSITSVWKASDHIDWTLQEQHDKTYNTLAFDIPTKSLDPIYYGDSALDRTHTNVLIVDPTDNNLMISVRHFDSIYKLDWENEGTPMYNLQEYALFDADYNPIVKDYDNDMSFFSHQHCIELYEVEGRPDLKLATIFDNVR